ncbi:hypothetical protein [Streptomyces bluensis]|uniref:hypothetical protein n=1 Tax=Streptomyces bluensis TaxID=33897 RepID=UPI003330BAE5
MGEAPGHLDAHVQDQPQAQPQAQSEAQAQPDTQSQPQAHTNTLQGTPHIAGSTIQVGDVTNLHVHSAPAGGPPNGQVPHHSPPPAPSTPPTPPGRNSQPSGVIIRVEIGHQRYIEIFDEGLARYIINAHLKEMGLGHE